MNKCIRLFREAHSADEMTVSASDYTVRVLGLPENLTSREELAVIIDF